MNIPNKLKKYFLGRRYSRVFLLFFGSCCFVLGCYLTVTNVIFPIIFAVEQAEKAVDTATDFGYGTFSDTEVAGSGAGAVVRLNGDGGENWYSGNWQYRKKITIDHTKIDANLTNFPVLISLGSDSNLADDAQNDFDDILFADTNKTKLDHEIEEYDESTGQLIAWVRVLSISSSTDTEIYLYYGNGSCSNQENVNGVWDSSHQMVQHLEESPANGAAGHIDSTSNPNNGIPQNFNGIATSTTDGAGQIDGADIFDGSNDYVVCGNHTSLNITDAITIEMWVKTNTVGGSSGYLISKNHLNAGDHQYAIYTSGGRAYYYGGGSPTTPAGVIPYNVWTYVVFTRNNSGSGQFYINGQASGSSASCNLPTKTFPVRLGCRWNAGTTPHLVFNGTIDEVKIYNRALDVNEISTQFKNQDSPSNFYSLGSEESALAPLGSWQSAGSGADVIDLVWNWKWKDDPAEGASFAANIDIPANTSVKFEAQSAADPANFAEANYKDLGVCTPGNQGDPCPTDNVFKKTAAELGALGILTKDSRYIRIRATLTSSDGISNPSVDKITVYYFKDNSKPSKNPDTIEARDQQGGTIFLSTNEWHNYPNPWFKWQGAEDDCADPPESCSGIKGYYAYFGNDAAAIPETAGLPQDSDEYKALSLSSGETYYLRLQAYDLEENYFVGDDPPAYPSYTLFTYKYDKTPPENPGYISCPSDFLSTKKFSFFWPTTGGDAATDPYSGVKGYQYKIGDCPWYGPNHTDPDGLEDYFPKEAGNYETNETYDYDCLNEGTSYIYLRTIDEAGNVSSSTIQGVVKINTAAPSAPRNLTVNPDYSKENSFSFSWQEPEIQPAPIEEYRYSINSLPTETNYTSAAETSLPENPYATIRGVNTFYVAAVAQGGAVNWKDYAQVNFECDSAAPGIPLSLEAFDNSIRATKNYKVGLTWDAPEFTGTGFEGFKIYRSETKGADCQKNFSLFEEIAATQGTAYVDSNLESKTYYYCLKAYDNTNQLSSPSSTASIKPTGRWTSPPGLIEEPEAFPKTRSATIAWLISREGNSFVQYGIKSSVYGNEIGSSLFSACHSIVLTGLEPDTVYFYRVLFTDEDGNTGTSNECSFKTGPPPIVSEVSVSDISLYSAYLSFTVENAIKASVYYGKTTMYGGALAISTSTKESSYTLRFSGLDDGALYHYMIELKDEEGNKYLFEDHTFETLPRPRVSNVKVDQVFDRPSATLKIEFDSNTPISTICSFWPTGDPSQKKEVYDIKPKTKHSIEISGLKDNTLYLLLARGIDRLGNEAQSDIQRITTATDTRPPKISNLYVEQNITGQGREAKSQVIVSWNTDEPATGQVGYIQSSAGSFTSYTKEDIILTTSHSVVISGLSPSTIYKLGAVSYDGARNKTVSEDYILITQKATESVLDLILRSLRNTFGR